MFTEKGPGSPGPFTLTYVSNGCITCAEAITSILNIYYLSEERIQMKKTIALSALLALGALGMACGGDSNVNVNVNRSNANSNANHNTNTSSSMNKKRFLRDISALSAIESRSFRVHSSWWDGQGGQ